MGSKGMDGLRTVVQGYLLLVFETIDEQDIIL